MDSESIETKKKEDIILYKEIYKIYPIWCEQYAMKFNLTSWTSVKLNNTHVAKEFLKSYVIITLYPDTEAAVGISKLQLYDLKCLCEFVLYNNLKESN